MPIWEYEEYKMTKPVWNLLKKKNYNPEREEKEKKIKTKQNPQQNIKWPKTLAKSKLLSTYLKNAAQSWVQLQNMLQMKPICWFCLEQSSI